MEGKTCQEIMIGERGEFSKTVSESDIYWFAGITGDMNPMHINQEYAEKTFFGKRIAHGVLSLGFISKVLGTKLPGPGAIYIKQVCQFLKPVFIGDTITATVEVIQKDVEKNRILLRTCCTNQRQELVLDGEAIMMPRKGGPIK